jgi:hypothetical protein
MAKQVIDDRQLKRLERNLATAGHRFEKGAQRFLKKLGVWVQGRARELCPESPTLSQYARMNKSGKTKRKNSSITTGSLRDSITVEEKKLAVEIGIPDNSRGGKYAEKIHDQRGREWKNLGPRSQQKGATDKFIFKAAEDSKREQSQMIDAVIDEFIKGIGI